MMFKWPSQYQICRNFEIGYWQWEWNRRNKFGIASFVPFFWPLCCFALFMVSKGFVVRADLNSKSTIY